MENQKPRIELYKIRSFGAKISDTFAFVSENFKPLFKFVTYFLLPLSLVEALSLNGFMSGYQSLIEDLGMSAGTGEVNMGSMSSFGVGMLSYVLLYVIGYMLLSSIVYALMTLYGQRADRLAGVTMGEIKPLLLRNLRRSGLLFLVGLGIVVVLGAVCVMLFQVSPALIFLLYLILMVFAVPFALVAPAFFLEDEQTVFGSFAKAWHIGFPTWGGIFGTVLVLSIIAGILQMIVQLPWQMLSMVKLVLGMQGEESALTSSVGYGFLVYLLAVVASYGAYLAHSLLVIGIAYQYGHACEKVDRVTVADDIEHFEQL